MSKTVSTAEYEEYEAYEKKSLSTVSTPLTPTPQQRIVWDNLMNGLYLVDMEQNIAYWNVAAEQILGLRSEEVLGKSCKDNILLQALSSEIPCDTHCPLVGDKVVDVDTYEPITLTLNLRHKNGHHVPVQIRSVPFLGPENQVLGAVEIFERADPNEDVNLQLKKLEQIAYFDSLTKISNRRYVEEALKGWLRVHAKRNWSFAVAMADIDFFKNVNDKYGHDAGDLVLQNVARILRKNLRSADIVGRWGGEEFLILLQNIRPGRVWEKLDSLRKAIEEGSVKDNGVEIRVTMSFGGATPHKGDTVLSLVGRADDFLYQSKREGRNRVNVAEPVDESTDEADDKPIK
jgi:diguanylate cyclase (GGDEF)-like protein/PAS domain S-box-containing protein